VYKRQRALLPEISGPFDLIFIDADKYYYSTYYELVIDKLRPGGILMADNVLWSGKILVQQGQKIDKDTQALLDFNQQLAQDPRVETLLLPIRDGILLARKK
jgi:caffeoyl-CoA O-methyltransferase